MMDVKSRSKDGTFVFLRNGFSLRILSLYGYGLAFGKICGFSHGRPRTFATGAFWEDMYVRVCSVISELSLRYTPQCTAAKKQMELSFTVTTFRLTLSRYYKYCVQ